MQTGTSLGLLAFLVGIAHWPMWSSGTLTTRWAVLAVTVPLLLLFQKIRPTPAHWIGAGVLVWAAVTLLWSPSPFDGGEEFIHLLLLAGVFCLAAEVIDTRPLLTGLACTASVSAFLVILQVLDLDHFPLFVSDAIGASSFPNISSPGGLFSNQNWASEAGIIGFIAAMGLRSWRRIALAVGPVIAMAFSTSKGPILAAGILAIAWTWKRSARAGACLFIVLCVAGALYIHARPASLDVRLPGWNAAIAALSVQGTGLGSFRAEYPRFAASEAESTRRYEHAHNEYLNYGVELGAGALLLFALFAYALRFGTGTEWNMLLAMLGVGLVSYPFHTPFTAFAVACAAGHLCGAGGRLRDDARYRGNSFQTRAAGVRPAGHLARIGPCLSVSPDGHRRALLARQVGLRSLQHFARALCARSRLGLPRSGSLRARFQGRTTSPAACEVTGA